MEASRAAAIRFEILLLGIFSVAWVVAFVLSLRLVSVDGALSLDLYSFFSVAAALGWLAGNLYVSRQPTLPGKSYRRRIFLNYLLGPPSFLFILRALAPLVAQLAAPLVPFYGLAVYVLFFMVPVTLRAHKPVER